MKKSHYQQIIFFDGVCGLCNGFVDLVLSRDSLSQFLFSPLQGQTAAEKFKNRPELLSLKSIVLLVNDNDVRQGSAAVLTILAALGGGWSLFRMFLLIPPILRECIYNWIAKNRYLWFGKREVCRLPTAAERERFLD